jgi:hypothetical protein
MDVFCPFGRRAAEDALNPNTREQEKDRYLDMVGNNLGVAPKCPRLLGECSFRIL